MRWRVVLIASLFFIGIFFGENVSLAKDVYYLASATDNKMDLLSGMTQKLSVKVIDELGLPIEDYTVNFKIIEGNAELKTSDLIYYDAGYCQSGEMRVATNMAGIAEVVVFTCEGEETNVLIEVTSDVDSGSPLYFSVNAQEGTEAERVLLKRWQRAHEKFVTAKQYFDDIVTPLSRKVLGRGEDVSCLVVSYQVIKKFIDYTKEDLEYLQKVICGSRHKKFHLDYFERLEIETDYLQQAIKDMEKELEEMISKTKKPFLYPLEVDSSEIRVVNGNFYVHNTPFFLIGPDYGNVELDELQKFGFNYLGISMPPMNVILGATSDDYIKRKGEKYHLPGKFTELFEKAEEENVMLTIYTPVSVDYQKMPQWLYGKDVSAVNANKFDINPAKKIDGKGCGSDHNMAFCILNSYTKEILESYYRKIIPQLREHSSVLSYMATGEIWYRCSPFCSLAENDFRQWLDKRYDGDIEKLNVNWKGTKYKTFEEIRLTDSHRGVNVQERFDYLEYNRWAVTEFFRWVSKTIKEIDPKARVHLRLGGYFDHYYAASIDRSSGMDLEALNNEIFDIAEVAAPVYDWRHQVFNSDLNRSLAGSRPGLDGEWTFLKRDDGEYGYDPANPYGISMSPEKYINSRLWDAFIHGKDAVGFFMWAREHKGKRWELLSRPKELEVLGKTALDIRRLAEYIVEFHAMPSEVALLYSVTSKLQPSIMDYIVELEKAYTGLFFLDTNIDFVTEHQINQGALANYKLLIVPRASYIKEDVYNKVEDFVCKGGNLFITNESLLLDEYGFERSLFFSAQDKKLVECGQGKTYYCHVDFSQTNERYYHDVFDELFNLVGINRPVRVLDDKGDNYWGIEMRSVSKGNDNIIYLLNLTHQPFKIKMKGIFSEGGMKDLISDRTIDVSSLILEPLEVLLLMDAGVENVNIGQRDER